MTTIKSYTDIEQSRKLAEILPVESADMWWAERYSGKVMSNGQYIVDKEPLYYPCLVKPSKGNYSQDIVRDIPCWSLAALLNVLPPIYNLKPILDLEENSIQYNGIDIYVKADNLVDACYELILKLHEEKML